MSDYKKTSTNFNWVHCYASIMLLMYPCNKYAKFSYKKKKSSC